MLYEAAPDYTGPVVYAIQAESGGAVKIGYASSSDRVPARLAALQSGNPERLVVVRIFEAPNGHEDETAVHRLLRLYRLEGEWFYNAPSVVSFTGCKPCPRAPTYDAFDDIYRGLMAPTLLPLSREHVPYTERAKAMDRPRNRPRRAA